MMRAFRALGVEVVLDMKGIGRVALWLLIAKGYLYSLLQCSMVRGWMSFFDVSSRHEKSPHRSVQQNRRGNFPSYFLHQPSAFHLLPSGRLRGGYSYWFFLLYCSVISRSFLNFSILSGFIFPAFKTLRFAFTQFSISCSSMRCFDGFLLLVLMKSITSSYLACHFSSCDIIIISNLISFYISDKDV